MKTGLGSDTERPAWDFVLLSYSKLGCGPAADIWQAVGKGAPCGAGTGGDGHGWAPRTRVGTLAPEPPSPKQKRLYMVITISYKGDKCYYKIPRFKVMYVHCLCWRYWMGHEVPLAGWRSRGAPGAHCELLLQGRALPLQVPTASRSRHVCLCYAS